MSSDDNPGQVPGTETWIYGGIRAGQDGKRLHAWTDPAGEEHWFSRTGTRMAVGSHYTVQVSRHDGTLTLHGNPEYAGSAADEATRRALWTEHTLAQTQLESRPATRATRRSLPRSPARPPRRTPRRAGAPAARRDPRGGLPRQHEPVLPLSPREESNLTGRTCHPGAWPGCCSPGQAPSAAASRRCSASWPPLARR